MKMSPDFSVTRYRLEPDAVRLSIAWHEPPAVVQVPPGVILMFPPHVTPSFVLRLRNMSCFVPSALFCDHAIKTFAPDTASFGLSDIPALLLRLTDAFQVAPLSVLRLK